MIINYVRLLCLPVFFLLNTYLSAQNEHIISSKFLQQQDTIHVYKPSEGEIENVVYMLHGWNGDFRQWGRIQDLQRMADSWNLLIVCPDAFKDSWYFDAQKKEDNIYYSQFFIQDLIPFIDQQYNTSGIPRIIYGLSMGGYGAFYIYLKHPDYFYAALSSSGAMDFTHPLMKNYGIEKRLGSYSKNKQLWEQMSMIELLKKADIDSGYHFYMDCGEEDPFTVVNKIVAEYLQNSPASLTYLTMPGGHNTEYWKSAVTLQVFLLNMRNH